MIMIKKMSLFYTYKENMPPLSASVKTKAMLSRSGEKNTIDITDRANYM